MKETCEKEVREQLGDRIRAEIIAKLNAVSETAGISRQQLTDDALSLYLQEGDEMVRQRQRVVLATLRRMKRHTSHTWNGSGNLRHRELAIA